ncbi:hypothetical protein B0H10DRAFT_636401 [Mycena sp. CBHHK59/15]|nr:hypothetical protein B0H10DRAFT_636401 [Mycena sp. CBHHK59/15]
MLVSSGLKPCGARDVCAFGGGLRPFIRWAGIRPRRVDRVQWAIVTTPLAHRTRVHRGMAWGRCVGPHLSFDPVLLVERSRTSPPRCPLVLVLRLTSVFFLLSSSSSNTDSSSSPRTDRPRRQSHSQRNHDARAHVSAREHDGRCALRLAFRYFPYCPKSPTDGKETKETKEGKEKRPTTKCPRASGAAVKREPVDASIGGGGGERMGGAIAQRPGTSTGYEAAAGGYMDVDMDMDQPTERQRQRQKHEPSPPQSQTVGLGGLVPFGETRPLAICPLGKQRWKRRVLSGGLVPPHLRRRHPTLATLPPLTPFEGTGHFAPTDRFATPATPADFENAIVKEEKNGSKLFSPPLLSSIPASAATHTAVEGGSSFAVLGEFCVVFFFWYFVSWWMGGGDVLRDTRDQADARLGECGDADLRDILERGRAVVVRAGRIRVWIIRREDARRLLRPR